MNIAKPLGYGLLGLGAVTLSAAALAQELPSGYAGVTIMTERVVPAPPGLSPEMLEVVKRRQIPPFIPAPETNEEWFAAQAAQDGAIAELVVQFAADMGVTYEPTEIAGVPAFIVTPKEIDPRWSDRVFMHNHGGAWVFGAGEAAVREAIWMASGLGVKVVSIDYRMPPLHPAPAAVEDAVAVWMELTKDQDASGMAMFGTSAGGNISLATTLKLKDMGAPLPGAVFAGTPATDLANVGDTWITLQGLDALGERTPGSLIAGAFAAYIGDNDPADPYLSPINGNLDGFPPTILISGTRDLLLSDTVRMHRALRAAGVEADLHVYDGQAHGDYMQNLLGPVPEAEDAQREIASFFDAHLE